MGLSNETAYSISKQRASALNDPTFDAANEFQGIIPENPGAAFPEMEKSDDVGRGGLEFANTICNLYWLPPGFNLPLRVNFDDVGRLFLRHLGGTITKTEPVTDEVWKHSAPMRPKSAGLQLPSSDLVVQNAADDFLIRGLVSNQFTLAQEGTALPIATFDLVGTGLFVQPAGFTSPEAASDVPCLDGALTEILLTDPEDNTINLYDEEDVRGWSAVLANNLVTDPARTRKGGDPLCGPTDGQAHYIQTLKRGNRTATAQITVAFDDNIDYWVHMAKNSVFTDVTFRILGPIIDGTTRFELAVVFPVATIRATPPADAQGDAAYVLNIVAKKDPVTLVGATGYVINDIENNFN